MREVAYRVPVRDDAATSGPPAGRPARTAEPRERPQWQGLFREPEWPPFEEADDA